MKILSSFTHPQVVPNMYAFLSPAEYKMISYFVFNIGLEQLEGK